MPKDLSIDKPLDKHLKPVKDSDGTMSAMELSTEKVRVKDLDILGEAKGQTPTANDGLATKQYVDDNAGGAYFIQSAGRGRCQYNNWYYCTHITYGGQYYYWFYSNGSTSLPSTWADSYHPSYLIPKAGTITGYTFAGNISSNDTVECAMMKGVQPTYGSAGDYSLSQVGATQSAGGANQILYKWEQTGLSVSVAKNDIIMPCFRRTTDNDASYVYFEVSINVIIE